MFSSRHPGPTDSIAAPLLCPLNAKILQNPPPPPSGSTGSAKTTTCAGSSASCPRATPTSPGCSTSSTTSRRKAWPASSSPMAACPPTSPAKATSAAPSSRPTSWTAWSPSPASSFTARRFPSASGLFPETNQAGNPQPGLPATLLPLGEGTGMRGVCATEGSKRCSSTPGKWARSSTASTAS